MSLSLVSKTSPLLCCCWSSIAIHLEVPVSTSNSDVLPRFGFSAEDFSARLAFLDLICCCCPFFLALCYAFDFQNIKLPTGNCRTCTPGWGLPGGQHKRVRSKDERSSQLGGCDNASKASLKLSQMTGRLMSWTDLAQLSMRSKGSSTYNPTNHSFSWEWLGNDPIPKQCCEVLIWFDFIVCYIFHIQAHCSMFRVNFVSWNLILFIAQMISAMCLIGQFTKMTTSADNAVQVSSHDGTYYSLAED